jgi:hypothetical protein
MLPSLPTVLLSFLKTPMYPTSGFYLHQSRNFNYGSTCAAQGLSLIGCQQGAGLAAYGTASKNALGGGPWTAGPGNVINPANANGLPDYGDQSIPSENPSVINGYNAQIWHQVCHQ